MQRERGQAWLEDQQTAADDAAARVRASTRPVFLDAASYLAAHPDGAPYIRSDRPVRLLPAEYDHRWCLLPGGYFLALSVASTDGRAHWVLVCDGDDGAWIRHCESATACEAVLDELADLGPIDPPALVEAWGFQPD